MLRYPIVPKAGIWKRAFLDGLHVDLPIHLHTHDTPGTQLATLLAAAQEGCQIVDGALASMSGLTSQPSLGALVACLEGDELCPKVPLVALDELSRYWEVVRSLYSAFDPGIKSTTTAVYHHEIPGGQYSNLYQQAVSVGLSEAGFHSLTQRYQEVNELLGDIIKVTPSSKVVGDFALLLEKHKLTGKQLLEKRPHLDYPDSVISFFKGHMGVPYGGFPQQVRELVLGSNPPPAAPEPMDREDSFEQVQKELEKKLMTLVSRQDVLSYIVS